MNLTTSYEAKFHQNHTKFSNSEKNTPSTNLTISYKAKFHQSHTKFLNSEKNTSDLKI